MVAGDWNYPPKMSALGQKRTFISARLFVKVLAIATGLCLPSPAYRDHTRVGRPLIGLANSTSG